MTDVCEKVKITYTQSQSLAVARVTVFVISRHVTTHVQYSVLRHALLVSFHVHITLSQLLNKTQKDV